MDWSLVLVSQGIETTIEHHEEAGWGLLIAQTDYPAAMAAIRQYRFENRRWKWQQEVWRPGLLFDWTSLGWVLLIAFFFRFDMEKDLRTPGQMLVSAVSAGQWWRPFTAVWLHADLGHLAANATFGLVLLGLTLGRFGTGVGLLVACLAGAGGNLARWVLRPDANPSLGASGMIMGALGMLAAASLPLWRSHPRPIKGLLTGIAAGLMLFVLLGLTPGTDVIAHAGGFLSGLLLGIPLAFVPSLPQRPKLNLLCALVFAMLIMVPWYCALRR